MKMKKRTLKRTLKYIVSFVLLLSLFSNLPLMLAGATTTENSTAPAETPVDMHEYHEGIVDGGIYCIRNLGNGDYMDVDNALTAAGTMLSTYTYHAGPNQQFRLEYMGDDTYRMIPINAPNMYINQPLSAEGSPVSLSPDYVQENGAFRLKRYGENVYAIYVAVSNYQNVLCIDSTAAPRVLHRNFDNLSTAQQPYALWALERYGTQYESYDTFYIRSATHNLYLNSDPNIIAARVAPFTGTDAQQWKQTVATTDSYYFSPLNTVYRHLNIKGGSVTLRISGQVQDLTHRQFLIENATVDASGNLNCNIAAYLGGQKMYLNVGNYLLDDPTVHGVLFSNKAEGNDVWVFERVTTTSRDPKELIHNQWLADGGTVNRGTTKWYSFAVDKNARYKIELSGSNVTIGTVEGLLPVTELDRDTANNKMVEVFLNDSVASITGEDTYTIYRIPIVYTGATSNANTAFNYSLCVQQSPMSIHLGSMYEGDDIPASGLYGAWGHIESLGYSIDTKSLISASEALEATHAVTGISDFQSDIFIYNGHGEKGSLEYDLVDPLDVNNLPNMEGCKLAIWAACESAKNKLLVNFVSKSIAQGADAAIGWSKTIDVEDTRLFMKSFFGALAAGDSIDEAQRYALSLPACCCTNEDDYEAVKYTCNCAQSDITCPCENSYSHYNYIYGILDSLVIQGNVDVVLLPASGTAAAMTASLETTEMQSQVMFDKSAYTLMLENTSTGAKLYSKLMNGIPTDDIYIEYYKNGVLVDTYKSDFNLEDCSTQMSAQQTAQTLAEHPDVSAEDLAYIYVDGTWQLIERRTVTVTHGNHICSEIVYVNITAEGVTQ